MKKLNLLMLSLMLSISAYSQVPNIITNDKIVLIGKPNTTGTTLFVPPSSTMGKVATANINIIFKGTWDPAARAALLYAKGIWEKTITSTETILIDAYYESLPAPILGQITNMAWSSSSYWLSYADPTEPPVIDATIYPQALAKKLMHTTPSNWTNADFEIRMSSNISWYLGTDGACPSNKYDLVTVALHEIGHGLGFSSSVSNSGGSIHYQY